MNRIFVSPFVFVPGSVRFSRLIPEVFLLFRNLMLDNPHVYQFFPSQFSWQSFDFHHRPNFDSADTRSGNPCSDVECLVQIAGVNEEVAAELFARLRKWSIGYQPFTFAYAHG